ncbi:MAG: DUF3667 domain-containing protein [Luteimonas sp.]
MRTLRWTCPSCGGLALTPFCPSCGERRLAPADLRLRDVLVQAFNALTSVDGRLLRSLRDVCLRPGELTLAYLEGRRKPYLGPLELFFLANVVFFALQSLADTRSFSTTLASHLQQQDWRGFASVLVERHLQATHRSLSAYAPVFDRRIAVYARSLIVLMVVPFALLVAALFGRRPVPALTHAIFAVHTYVFFLLLLCAGSLVVAIDRLVGGPALRSPAFDHVLSVLLLAACVAYLHRAVARVYPGKSLPTALRTALLGVAIALVFMGYRFILLPITLWTT